jgi:hypothetical protein
MSKPRISKNYFIWSWTSMRAFEYHVKYYMTINASRTYYGISDHDTVQSGK